MRMDKLLHMQFDARLYFLTRVEERAALPVPVAYRRIEYTLDETPVVATFHRVDMSAYSFAAFLYSYGTSDQYVQHPDGHFMRYADTETQAAIAEKHVDRFDHSPTRYYVRSDLVKTAMEF